MQIVGFRYFDARSRLPFRGLSFTLLGNKYPDILITRTSTYAHTARSTALTPQSCTTAVLYERGIRFERFITNSRRNRARGRQPERVISTTIRVNLETYSDRIAFRRAQQHNKYPNVPIKSRNVIRSSTVLHVHCSTKVCTPWNLPIILSKANALSYETIFGSLGCRTMHYDSLWLRCQGSGKVMHCMVGGGCPWSDNSMLSLVRFRMKLKILSHFET